MHEVGAALAADSGLRVAGSLTSSGTTTLATGVSPGTSGLIVGSPPTPPTIMSGVYAPSGWSNYVTEWYVGSNQIAYLSPAGQFVLPAQLGGLYVAGQGEIAGNVKADSNLTVSGTLTTATISGGSQGAIVLTSPPQLPKFTTAALPANCAVGQMVYVSDGRKQGEAAGSGTGVTAVCTLLTSKSSPAWVPLLIASSAVAN